MTGRINRDSRREDVRSRRKTLRQSALDAKRGTDASSKESPDGEPSGRVTRGALRSQTARTAAARTVEEKKMRKAITDREVQKAKPPFNNYVRVKHSGLSPFRSFQEAQKRSKIAPWRAQAPKPAPVAPSLARPVNTNRAPVHAIAAITKPAVQPAAPEMKMAAGVMQFPILPHMLHAQITFRAPAKVQPIPFSTIPTKSVPPAKKEVPKENVKPVPNRRPVRGVSLKAQSKQLPKVTSQTKLQGAAPAMFKDVAQVAKPARKPAAVPVTKAAQSTKIPKSVRAKSAAPSKPSLAKAPETAKRVSRLGRRTELHFKEARFPLGEAVSKEANKRVPEGLELPALVLDEKVLAEQIKPPARVLRSSSRLQHRDKENLLPDNQPALELPLVQRRRNKKPTIVAPIDEPEYDDRLQAALAEAAPEPANQPEASPEPADQLEASPEPASQLEAAPEPANQPEAALESASQPEVTSEPAALLEVVTSSSCGPSDERVKGLEERSSRLIKESDRLRSLADVWVATKSSDEDLTQNAVDEIDAITGQTYLLTTKKFIQYKGLIEGAYENPKTTLDDLDGFWEMILIQVEQLDNQYRELEEMKKRSWANLSPVPVKKQTKKSAKPPNRPPPKTNFRKFLAEKKKEITSSGSASTSSESAVGKPSQAGPKPQLLSPGLNMSVDEFITSPVRSAQSSLCNGNTPARRDLRFAESPARPNSSLLGSIGTADTSMRKRLRTPRCDTQRVSTRKSARIAKTPGSRSTRVADSPLQKLMRVTDSPLQKSMRVADSPLQRSMRMADSPLQRSMRVADSPLQRSMRVADSSFRGSPRGADSPFRDSPRVLENARRASRSINLSTAMMRVSLAIANELE